MTLIDPRLLPEAAALFSRIIEIMDGNDDMTFEALGGRRREYLDLGVELQQLLGLSISDAEPQLTFEDVMRADENDPESWQHARALRAELEAVM